MAAAPGVLPGRSPQTAAVRQRAGLAVPAMSCPWQRAGFSPPASLAMTRANGRPFDFEHWVAPSALLADSKGGEKVRRPTAD